MLCDLLFSSMVPFFFLHADVKTELVQHNNAWNRQKCVKPSFACCLSVYGKDESGESVTVRLRGYRIQFYVSFRDHSLSRYCCTALARDKDDQTIVSIKSVFGYESMLIDEDHQIGDKDSYEKSVLDNVFSVQVRTKRDVITAIRKIEEKVREYYSGSLLDCQSAVRFYESNMDVVTLATRRLRLNACRWNLLNTELCSHNREVSVGREYVFHEIGIIDPIHLFSEPVDYTNTCSSLTPLVKVLSFDIECLSSTVETMPDANTDCIIQISTVTSSDILGRDQGCVMTENDSSTPNNFNFKRELYTTGGGCSAIPGVDIHAFVGEKDMLQAFVDHLFCSDPDILTGYNICEFDLPYIFRRLQVHGIDAFMGKGRLLATCVKRSCEIERRHVSFIPKTHNITVPGRVVFDMYTHLRKEVNLRSYTLNSVSTHFLGRKKDDISYRDIPTMYNGDGDTRARLGRYCVKDAQLVLEIAFVTQTFVHALERCKVFRTILQYIVDRGQQVRFYSLLLAWCSERKILVNDVTNPSPIENEIATTSVDGTRSRPEQRRGNDNATKKMRLEDSFEYRNKDETYSGGVYDDTYETDHEDETNATTHDSSGKTKKTGYDGATVLEPITGIYYTPIIVLDYASLYPSIMIAHNLCFTTWIRDKQRGEELVRFGRAEQSPVGVYFLTRSTKKGVIPSILEMLLDERARVRKLMRDTNPLSMEYKVLDGQQSALKLAANSIYGAIGCNNSILNFVQIPSSVTAYGRNLISITKDHVESNYAGVRVVYGDTDSVMIDLTYWNSATQNIGECVQVGRDMAASTTSIIGRTPIMLQFETVYRPFLLCSKKRYAAGVYNNLGVADSVEQCRPTIKYKGLQVVRRDNCTFATRLMEFTLETLLDEKGESIRRVTDGLRLELTRLFDGDVNMRALVITKEWKRKCTNAQAHDRLARRMQIRDPNSAPNIGDRVPYVIVTVPSGAKLCDRAEDPIYVLEKRLPLDLLYYADSQVAKPIAELLRVVLPGRPHLEEIKDLFWPVNGPRRESDKRRREGEKRWMYKASMKNRRIDEYFSSSQYPTNDVVDLSSRVSEARVKLTDVEDVLDSLAETCMACKKNDVQAIQSCRNRDCDTLYERFSKLNVKNKIMKTLEEVKNNLDNTENGSQFVSDKVLHNSKRLYHVFTS